MSILVHIILLIREKKYVWHLSLSVWNLAGASEVGELISDWQVMRLPSSLQFTILSTYSLAQSLGPEMFSRAFDNTGRWNPPKILHHSQVYVLLYLKFLPPPFCCIYLCASFFLCFLQQFTTALSSTKQLSRCLNASNYCSWMSVIYEIIMQLSAAYIHLLPLV